MGPTLDDIRRALDKPPQHGPEGRLAAVAAIFNPRLELLLIRRAEHPGDPWSGHVALPGGRVDRSDPSPLHAAIREVHEEIGLALRPEHLLGELDEVQAVSGLPDLRIRPFVFALPDDPRCVLNHEVASVHRLSLARLLADEGRGPMPFEWNGLQVTLPRVDFDGQRLWGLTLRVVDDLLERIDGRGIGLDRVR